MSTADRIRNLTTAVARRDAAAAEPMEPPVAAARTDPFRTTLDLQPDDYATLQRWIVDAAVSTGRGRLTVHEVIYAAVLATTNDETVGRRVRAILATGQQRLTRPKRKASGT